MRFCLLFAFFQVPVLAAGLPVTFETGSGAKAAQVNQNFKYLDSAVNNHAKQLENKADQSAVLGIVSIVGAKVDTAALTTRLTKYVATTGLSSYATSATLTTGLGAKVDTAKLAAALGKEVDTAALTTRLGDYAKTSALSDYAKTSALSGYATSAALTTGLATKPDRSEVMVVGKTGAVIPTSVAVSGADPLIKAGLSTLASGQLTFHTDTSATSYGLPAWYVEASAANGFQIGRYGGGPTSTTFHLEILQGTGITLRGAVKTTDSLVVGKNLRVTGKITAVAAGSVIPDYVFEPEYKLATLREVESFTQANKHLPDVPSAAEIKAGGLDLTEMNLTLLRKVEELTLHAIAQEKRIQNLEAQQSK